MAGIVVSGDLDDALLDYISKRVEKALLREANVIAQLLGPDFDVSFQSEPVAERV